MKKLLFCLAIFAMATLTSCKKETTYTFVDRSENTNGRLTILKEYDINGLCIANNSIETTIPYQNYNYIANERSELVKIYVSWGSTYRWVQQVYYLEKGKNTNIEINGYTIVGPAEP